MIPGKRRISFLLCILWVWFFVPLVYGNTNPEEIISRLSTRLKPWIGFPPEDVFSLEYNFSLNNQAQKIEVVRDKKNDTRDFWQGITLNTGLEEILRSPDSFELKIEETADATILKAKKKQGKITLKCGNGVAGWYGYFKAFSDVFDIHLQKNTLVPLSEKHKITKIYYKDWISINTELLAPRSIEVFHRDLVFRMSFQLYENRLWILDRSEYEFKKELKSTVHITDIEMNNPELVRRVEKELFEQEQCKKIIRSMLDCNTAWISGKLEAPESLEYTHLTVPKGVSEKCYVDKQGLVIMEIASQEKGDAGKDAVKRKILLPESRFYDCTGNDRFATPRALTEFEKRFFIKETRKTATLGTALNLPIGDYSTYLDSLHVKFEGEKEWNGKLCTVFSITNQRQCYLNAGARFGLDSSSYMHRQRPVKESLYIDKERNIPLHETLVTNKNERVFEIDFKNWVNTGIKAWAPLRIEITCEDFFSCHYDFQLLKGNHWFLKEAISWFDPQDKTRGKIVDVKIDSPSPLKQHAIGQIENTTNLLKKNAAPPHGKDSSKYKFRIGKRIPIEVEAKCPIVLRNPNDKNPFKNYTALKEAFFTLNKNGELQASIRMASTEYNATFPISLSVVIFDETGGLLTADTLTTEVRVGDRLYVKDYMLNLGCHELLGKAEYFSAGLYCDPPRADIRETNTEMSKNSFPCKIQERAPHGIGFQTGIEIRKKLYYFANTGYHKSYKIE